MTAQDMTRLQAALAAVQAAPEDAGARVRFHGALAAAELHLLLTEEPQGEEAISPQVAETSEGRFVLAFDAAERLAEFAGRAAAYAALPGRVLAGMLQGQGLGIALNPGAAADAYLLPADAVAWLAGLAAQGPAPVEARIAGLSAPAGLPDALLVALESRLTAAAGLAQTAWLAGVAYRGGGAGHLLAIVGARDGAEAALAGAVQEALAFSGLEEGALDVGFFGADDPLVQRLARHAVRFDLPAAPAAPVPDQRPAPGRDPDRPPILR